MQGVSSPDCTSVHWDSVIKTAHGGTAAHTHNESDTFDASNLLHVALATCHTVSRLDNGELAGNKVECELVRHFDLPMKKGYSDSTEVGVRYFAPGSFSGEPLFRTIRQFEFDQKIQLQSVLVDFPTSDRTQTLFTKGSPEKVAAKCRPDSLPADFHMRAKAMARDGYYLIAIASRPVADLTIGISRELLEDDLSFLGLVFFKNELKPCSKSAIESLRQGGINSVMVTGDNVWNGLHVAKKCGIVQNGENDQEEREMMVIATMVDAKLLGEKLGGKNEKKLVWQFEWAEGSEAERIAQGNSAGIDPIDIMPIVAELKQSPSSHKYRFAMTNAAMTYLAETDFQLLEFLFDKTLVFASMNPAGKVEVVTRWSNLGAIVGMCGDGGNDCGALKAAHVGLALVSDHAESCKEVSLVAPFSASGSHQFRENEPGSEISGFEDQPSPQAVVELVREGRCALVNSTATFRWFVLTGCVTGFCKVLIAKRDSYYSEMAFFLLDAFLPIFFVYVLNFSKPRTGALYGRAPEANLAGRKVWGSLGLVVGVMMLALLAGICQLENWASWYVPVDVVTADIMATAWWDKQSTFLSGREFVFYRSFRERGRAVYFRRGWRVNKFTNHIKD